MMCSCFISVGFRHIISHVTHYISHLAPDLTRLFISKASAINAHHSNIFNSELSRISCQCRLSRATLACIFTAAFSASLLQRLLVTSAAVPTSSHPDPLPKLFPSILKLVRQLERASSATSK
jgi:hypothetical protein